MYRFRAAMLPGIMLIVMGSIDALTTIIGVLHYGASELNPFLAGIVHTNIFAFLALKLAATFFIGLTYVVARSILNQTQDKTSKGYQYSNLFTKVAYAGVILFLAMVIINNFIVLLS
ncbi:MAG: DUF5658 family protein [Candidatus Bathyarchaeia archaeon]